MWMMSLPIYEGKSDTIKIYWHLKQKNGENFKLVLLDTCALIWWTLDPGKLSETAAGYCNDIVETGALISSISIWEIGIKIKKGSLDLGVGLEEYVTRA